MPISDDDFEGYEDAYGGFDAVVSDQLAATEPRSEGSGAPDRRATAALPTGDVMGARDALEKARDAHEAAQDALADAEGRIAVLEIKAEAIEADDEREPWQKAAAREDLAKARRAFRRAGTLVERTEQKLAAAGEQLDAEEQALGAVMAAPAEADPKPEPPRFATVELFVEKFVLPNWIHKYVANRVHWCAQWWEHAEAITRLEAIWEAFEVMRLQPAPSFSTWMRDHFDTHMRTLTDPEGVFFDCDVKTGQHTPNKPWQLTPAPHGMFAVMEAAQIQPPTSNPAAGAPADSIADGRSVVSQASDIKTTSPAGAAAAAPAGAGANITKRTTTSGVSR